MMNRPCYCNHVDVSLTYCWIETSNLLSSINIDPLENVCMFTWCTCSRFPYVNNYFTAIERICDFVGYSKESGACCESVSYVPQE
jgi:hypothetical protein